MYDDKNDKISEFSVKNTKRSKESNELSKLPYQLLKQTDTIYRLGVLFSSRTLTSNQSYKFFHIFFSSHTRSTWIALILFHFRGNNIKSLLPFACHSNVRTTHTHSLTHIHICTPSINSWDRMWPNASYNWRLLCVSCLTRIICGSEWMQWKRMR